MKMFLAAILCAAAVALFAAAFVASSLNDVDSAVDAYVKNPPPESLLVPDANKTAKVSKQPDR
jgi:hypothetical protein